MFVIYSDEKCVFVSGDRKTSSEYPDAKQFETWGEASRFSQNFGPDFEPMDVEDVQI